MIKDLDYSLVVGENSHALLRTPKLNFKLDSIIFNGLRLTVSNSAACTIVY